MSDQPLSELPPEIGLLLSLEREAYGDDLALRAAVLLHVERSVTLRGPAGGGSGGGAGGVARELLGPAARVLGAVATGAFVAGALVGGLVMRAASPTAVTPAIVAPLATTTASAQPPPDAVVPEPTAASSSGVAVPAPHAPPSAEPRPSAKPVDVAAGGSDLVREREVIDAARAALARGRPADALVATTRHAERWPHGHLVEEREVIAIQALAASGRRAEAERRAAAFKRAFPSSMLIPAVDAALSPP